MENARFIGSVRELKYRCMWRWGTKSFHSLISNFHFTVANGLGLCPNDNSKVSPLWWPRGQLFNTKIGPHAS